MVGRASWLAVDGYGATQLEALQGQWVVGVGVGPGFEFRAEDAVRTRPVWPADETRVWPAGETRVWPIGKTGVWRTRWAVGLEVEVVEDKKAGLRAGEVWGTQWRGRG